MTAPIASQALIITNLPETVSPQDIIMLFRAKSNIELGPADLKILPNKKRGGYTAVVTVPSTEADKAASETRGADVRGNTIRVRVDKLRVKPSASTTPQPAPVASQAPPNSTVLVPPAAPGTAPSPIVTPPGSQVIMPAAAPASPPIAAAAGIIPGTASTAQQPTVIVPPTPAVPSTVVPPGTPTVSNRAQQQNAISQGDLKIILERPRDPNPDGTFSIGIQTFSGGKGTKARFKVSANTPAAFYDEAGQEVPNQKRIDTGKNGHTSIGVNITNPHVRFATVHLDFEGGTRLDVNLSR